MRTAPGRFGIQRPNCDTCAGGSRACPSSKPRLAENRWLVRLGTGVARVATRPDGAGRQVSPLIKTEWLDSVLAPRMILRADGADRNLGVRNSQLQLGGVRIPVVNVAGWGAAPRTSLKAATYRRQSVRTRPRPLWPGFNHSAPPLWVGLGK